MRGKAAQLKNASLGLEAHQASTWRNPISTHRDEDDSDKELPTIRNEVSWRRNVSPMRYSSKWRNGTANDDTKNRVVQ